MLFPLPLLLYVLAPASVVVVFFLLTSHWRADAVRQWAVTAAIGGGFFTGFAALTGLPQIPPASVMQWLGWSVVSGAAVFILTALLQAPAKFDFAIFFILAGGCYVAWLLPFIRQDWSPLLSVAWVGGLGIATGLAGLAVSPAVALAPLGLLFDYALLALATSIVMMLFHSLILAQLSGILFVILATHGVTSLALRRGMCSRGAVFSILLILSGIWLQGWFYANGPAASILGLLIAAWTPSLRRFPALQSTWPRRFSHTGLLLIPLSYAIWEGWRSYTLASTGW